jgi:adenine-specific DNA-methyltransferase
MDAGKVPTYLEEAGISVDVAYLDPPYNQHPYGSNYHVLNTVALWDKPELTEKIQGRNKAAIREDWQTERRSAYNYKASALAEYRKTLQALQARYVLTSYSTDGYIPLEGMLEACISKGHTQFALQHYKRYRVSSQRFSDKPLNVEFVLVVDAQRPHVGRSASEMANLIREAEEDALSRHPETATPALQPSLFD